MPQRTTHNPTPERISNNTNKGLELAEKYPKEN